MSAPSNGRGYGRKFFASIAGGSFRAASVLLPQVRKYYPFTSLCDVGCGSGTWLRAAAECVGTNAKLTGIDGEHARAIVDCPGATFVFQNLEDRITGVPRHDLVLSLEVAEHLSPERGATFVDDLCAIADAALFGGAVEHQGGKHHVNEQPQSYWLAHFRRNGYGAYDVHRAALWHHPAFADCPYYVGNSLLYIREGTPLARELVGLRLAEDDLIDVVHPGLLRIHAEPGLKTSIPVVFAAIRRAVRRRLH